MKKNKIYKRALLGLAIANCFLLIACANSNVDEGAQLDGGSSEEAVADMGSGGADKAGGDEMAALEGGGDKAAADKAGGGEMSDLDAAMSDTGATPPPADGAAAANPPPGGDLAAAAGGKSADEDLEKAMSEPGAGSPDPVPAGDATAPPPAGDAPPATPDKAVAANEPPPADASAPPPPADPAAAPGGELAPPPADPAAPVVDAAAASAPRVAKAPRVKQEAFHKGTATLNRFYFARKGDDAKKISQLIYGNPDRAKDIKKWNKGSFKPGKLVYYQSPNAPEDGAMKSFYEERGLTPEQYQVKAGEKLSRIAKKKLGATGSWKEIAVINGIQTLDGASEGQNLAIYTDLNGGAQPQQQPPAGGAQPQQQANAQVPQQPDLNNPSLANGAVPPGGAVAANDPMRGAQPPPQPIGGEPPPAGADPNAALNQANPAQPPTPPVNEFQPPKKRKSEGGVNMGKLLQQNAFFLVMGLGISGLLLALLAINKRKRAARSEDFNEDGFGATAVRKRR